MTENDVYGGIINLIKILGINDYAEIQNYMKMIRELYKRRNEKMEEILNDLENGCTFNITKEEIIELKNKCDKLNNLSDILLSDEFAGKIDDLMKAMLSVKID